MKYVNIPLLNLEDFTQGDAQQKATFVETLGKAFEEVGFVSIRNHGISDDDVETLYNKVKDFFSLEENNKMKYEIAGMAGQRGYTSYGKESAKGSEVGDMKEFWQHGQTLEGDVEVSDTYPDNIKVEEVGGFDDTLLRTYRQFEVAGGSLLEAIALYLNLPLDYFNEKVHMGNSILRLIHYPPILKEPKSAVRAESHEDINLITLLVGASAEGLQVLTKQDEWLPINAGPGQIIVNVGDMLQRLTNNKLRSTTHRVVNPPKEKWHTSRYSIPFFLHPKSEMKLDCLENCVEDKVHYDPITAGEYLNERLRELGLLKED